MGFQPRRAIVTVSDSGIGRATTVALAGAGMDVGVIWHSDEAGAQDTAAEVRRAGDKAEVSRLDTADLGGCGEVIDELADRLGGVDVFVNNAGTGSATPALETTLEQWRRVVATDLDGAFVCLQRAARRMVASGAGGRLIAVTSVHEHQPRVGSAAYDAAKHGLGGLMKTLALELGQHAITANCAAPGEIATPMTGQEDDPGALEDLPDRGRRHHDAEPRELWIRRYPHDSFCPASRSTTAVPCDALPGVRSGPGANASPAGGGRCRAASARSCPE